MPNLKKAYVPLVNCSERDVKVKSVGGEVK